jgi:peptidoglycan/LPS O-acetylase OafA/YrhL
MPLDTQCSLLNWSPLVRLGDLSYSLYLFHWPIFVFHRYLNSHAYDLDFVWTGQASFQCKLTCSAFWIQKLRL